MRQSTWPGRYFRCYLMGFQIKRIARKSVEWTWNLCLKNSQNIQRKIEGEGRSFSVKNQGTYI